jgi:hypothetical protein
VAATRLRVDGPTTARNRSARSPSEVREVVPPRSAGKIARPDGTEIHCPALCETMAPYHRAASACSPEEARSGARRWSVRRGRHRPSAAATPDGIGGIQRHEPATTVDRLLQGAHLTHALREQPRSKRLRAHHPLLPVLQTACRAIAPPGDRRTPPLAKVRQYRTRLRHTFLADRSGARAAFRLIHGDFPRCASPWHSAADSALRSSHPRMSCARSRSAGEATDCPPRDVTQTRLS